MSLIWCFPGMTCCLADVWRVAKQGQKKRPKSGFMMSGCCNQFGFLCHEIQSRAKGGVSPQMGLSPHGVRGWSKVFCLVQMGCSVVGRSGVAERGVASSRCRGDDGVCGVVVCGVVWRGVWHGVVWCGVACRRCRWLGCLAHRKMQNGWTLIFNPSLTVSAVHLRWGPPGPSELGVPLVQGVYGEALPL